MAPIQGHSGPGMLERRALGVGDRVCNMRPRQEEVWVEACLLFASESS